MNEIPVFYLRIINGETIPVVRVDITDPYVHYMDVNGQWHVIALDKIGSFTSTGDSNPTH